VYLLPGGPEGPWVQLLQSTLFPASSPQQGGKLLRVEYESTEAHLQELHPSLGVLPGMTEGPKYRPWIMRLPQTPQWVKMQYWDGFRKQLGLSVIPQSVQNSLLAVCSAHSLMLSRVNWRVGLLLPWGTNWRELERASGNLPKSTGYKVCCS
jgi:hypothetical protein